MVRNDIEKLGHKHVQCHEKLLKASTQLENTKWYFKQKCSVP
jgi:hypothetical protein